MPGRISRNEFLFLKDYETETIFIQNVNLFKFIQMKNFPFHFPLVLFNDDL